MPTITLTATDVQVSRIIVALGTTDYTPNAAGIKQLLVDYLKDLVQQYEKNRAEQVALAAIASPTPLTLT